MKLDAFEAALRDCPDLPACKPSSWVRIALSVCVALWLGVVVFVVRKMW
jgi:hypothetical protein